MSAEDLLTPETTEAAEESEQAAESPRERGRVLQKRNPIASEYQIIGYLGIAPGAAADGEGADFRAFFAPGALTLGQEIHGRVDTFAQFQRYRGRVLAGATVRVFTPLPTKRASGLEVNASLTEVERDIDHYEAAWANIAATGDPMEAWLLERPRVSRDRIRTRVRTARVRGEYALSPSHTLFAQGIIGDFNDLHFRNRLELNFSSATPTASAEGIPGQDITYTAANTDNGTARRYFGHTSNRRTTLRAYAGGIHTAPRWTLEYSGYASRWVNRPLVHAWNFTDRQLQLAYTLENPWFPGLQLDPLDRITASNESLLANYRIQQTRTSDTDYAGRADLDVDLDGTGTWRFYAGTLYREKERVNDHERDVFGLNPANPLAFATIAEPGLPSPTIRGVYFLPPWIDAGRAIDIRGDVPSPYLRSNTLSAVETFEQRYRSFESVWGTYGILAYRGRQIDVEAGGRVEHTRTRTLGTVVVPAAFATESGRTIDQLTLNGEQRVVQERAATNSYTDFLGSVALIYRPARDWQLRFASYDSLMRPQYFDIVEYRRVGLPTRTISEGNPSLGPTSIRTYLVAAERTGLPLGDIAVELYQIDVDAFFYGAQRFENIDGIEFSVSRVENGQRGRIRGFQIQWQKDLPQLPMGMRANISTAYTYSESEASVETRPGESFDLPERSRHLMRTSLRVRWNGFTANLEYAYQSTALDQLGESAGRDIYRGDVVSLATGLSYTTGAYTFSASVSNLLNHAERSWAGERTRATRNQYASQLIRLGVAAQF
ncbi:MAG: outer membrane beta-barrel protein [Opitutales bacterium]|nr:outer membrane beta-barrel protein [Opitutales bacterium]